MTFTQPYDFMNTLQNPDGSFSKPLLGCRGMLFISIENLMQRRTQAELSCLQALHKIHTAYRWMFKMHPEK